MTDNLDRVEGAVGTPFMSTEPINFVPALGQRALAYWVCKRAIDVSGAAVLLLLLSPLLAVIAALIKVDSRGPVLFVQRRVGSRRRCSPGGTVWEIQNFSIYKFRSMFRDADETPHRQLTADFCCGLLAENESDELIFKLKHDSRITRLGRILRKTSLDELPQLLNVLKGEMSLVGPRPVPPYEVAYYEPADYGRLAALPGITGMWQTRGRCQVPFKEMVRMDIEYVRQCSLWLDLRILLCTVPTVLFGRGAS